VNDASVDGRYRLERQLGHGSMGEVWLAVDLELERPVALKLLAPDADRARFEREARAVAALGHPNVTRLYDYGESEGRPYIALEYVPGGTLEDRLSAGRPLQDEDTAAIATQLAAGLAHAHQHGLVHRDLKPANVLFDDEGRPKIADFGIAWIGGAPTLTDAGTVLGTAAYISPEHAAGEPATMASDVYSFGVILFRMLTGRLPFEADSALELVEMHRRLDAPPVEVLRPDAPAHLAAVAAAALERDPRRRPPDGAALAAELGLEPARDRTDAPTLVLRRGFHPARRIAAAVAALFIVAAGLTTAFLVARESSGSTDKPLPVRSQRTTTTAPATPAPSRATTAQTATRPRTAATLPVTPTTPLPTTLPTTTTVPTVPTVPTLPTTATTTTLANP
jgi:eukaryotic-like serine/threonine-protein kinase